MENIIISTEETSDLSAVTIKEYGIKTIGFDYLLDGTSYNTSKNNLDEQEFYEKLKNGAEFKSTQINEENIREYLLPLYETGKNILHIGFSSGLSGTFENFKKVVAELNEKFENKCYAVDSLCASAGQGLLTVLVAKKSQQNIGFDELCDYAENLKCRINHIFTVDDLKYLIRGGRLSKPAGFVANFLHIKPIMKMDKTGHLVLTQKTIGRKATIKKMLNKFLQTRDITYTDVLICEAFCKEDAEEVKKEIYEQTGINAEITPIDYCIGGHSGIGTLALFYVADNRD